MRTRCVGLCAERSRRVVSGSRTIPGVSSIQSAVSGTVDYVTRIAFATACSSSHSVFTATNTF
jgi:hypothetical protein